MDSGTTWNLDYGAADGVSGGKVAISADGDTVLWSTSANGVQVSQYTNAFASVTSLPAGAAIASDKKVNSIFYASSNGRFYLSTDGGKTFTSTATLGSSSSSNTVIVNPSVTGDVWVSTDTGIFHSVNNGTTFTTIPGATQVSRNLAILLPLLTSFRPGPSLLAHLRKLVVTPLSSLRQTLAALDTSGLTMLGRTGYKLTTRRTASDPLVLMWLLVILASTAGWWMICLLRAPRLPTLGNRVYIGTNGRGIFYGDTAGSAPPPSVSSLPVHPTSAPPSTITSKSSAAPTSQPHAPTTVKPSGAPTSKSSAPASSSHASSASHSAAPSGSSSAPIAIQTLYGQCGGTGYTGPTACACTSLRSVRWMVSVLIYQSRSGKHLHELQPL